ncbi:hypothetical protein [Lysinibacillus sp. NPDC056185]|uniref:hypothetical protein n=1 Tax=Lysinibacillus sp. NPDC056185 TaxID=3345739 RepID=UPI0039EF040B
MNENNTLYDATIVKLELVETYLYLTYLDWKEELKKIIFIDTISVEALDATGEEIGDFIIEIDNIKIQETCNKLKESAIDYKLFKILPAWNRETLIEIIAKEVNFCVG